MIIYLAKFILCSALFYAAYHLLLEKEKAHQFKRYYLLLSLCLSLTIPLLTFENSSNPILKETESYLNVYNDVPVTVNTVEISKPQEVNIYPNLMLFIYTGISTALLLRFGRNFYKIVSQKKGRAKAVYKEATVILSENISTPYSFLNYIFVNKTEFEHNQIAEGMLLHEYTHIRQRHSLDVIFIEFLQVFLWFNPMLFLYRKAIQTNHEYLADENVIRASQDIPAYQMLLLNHISTQCGLTLTSQFNYLTIKKRLTMMSKTNSIKAVLGKQLLLIPVLGIALFLFSTKTEAQVKKTTIPSQDINSPQSTKNGISDNEMIAYNEIEEKNLTLSKSGTHKVMKGNISESDKESLKSLYLKMSKDQRRQVTIAFIKHPAPLKPTIPTDKQFEALKNKNEYGIWIDEKKVNNEELNSYKASDFKQIFISKLYGGAKKGRIYNYQADLMTIKFYDKYRGRFFANRDEYLLVTQSYSKLASK